MRTQFPYATQKVIPLGQPLFTPQILFKASFYNPTIACLFICWETVWLKRSGNYNIQKFSKPIPSRIRIWEYIIYIQISKTETIQGFIMSHQRRRLLQTLNILKNASQSKYRIALTKSTQGIGSITKNWFARSRFWLQGIKKRAYCE